MRRILVERARLHGRVKHEGAWRKVQLDPEAVAGEAGCSPEELIEVDDALSRLEAHDRRMAEVVKLRYFAGLSVEEVARVLGVSSRTVDRDWMAARTWLYREVVSDEHDGNRERRRSEPE
jgi:RNA polymerase sigma factor (TIGR02999 family)